MPSRDELGTEYTTFPIHFGDDTGGYEIRVVATEDNTTISVPTFSLEVSRHAGEDYHFGNSATRFAFKVFCSKPCMVAQFCRSLPSGGSTGLPMGSFLVMVTPDEGASNNLIFKVPSIINDPGGVDGAISIITNTSPVTGLHLNDTSLTDLTWQLVENTTNSYATLQIGDGFYQLYSTEPSER